MRVNPPRITLEWQWSRRTNQSRVETVDLELRRLCREMCRKCAGSECMDAGNSRITVKVAGRLAGLDHSTGCLTRGPSVVRLQIPNHHGNKILLFAGSSLPPEISHCHPNISRQKSLVSKEDENEEQITNHKSQRRDPPNSKNIMTPCPKRRGKEECGVELRIENRAKCRDPSRFQLIYHLAGQAGIADHTHRFGVEGFHLALHDGYHVDASQLV